MSDLPETAAVAVDTDSDDDGATTDQQQPTQGGKSTDTDDDGIDWRAEAEKWKGLARKHEGVARKHEQRAATAAKTTQQQLDELREQLAQRDVADVERAGRLAMTQVRAGLADVGIKPDDVKDLLDEIEPTRLLADGEPDDEAVARIVGALRKAAGRPTPDRDQGKTGGPAPTDMSALIRRAAGYSIS